MPAKKIIVALLIIVVAIGGFVAGLVLLRERTKLGEEAAVPTGQAEVSLNPDTGDFNVGDTFKTGVYFNTANIPISGVAVRLKYTFSGTTPELNVKLITVNQSLISSGDWTCPTQNSSVQGEEVFVDVACANTSAAGFSTSTNTLLAELNFEVVKKPAVVPVIMRFDTEKSVITRKSDNEDILLIPTSTGSFTVGGAVATSTPIPTGQISPTPTTKLTITPTRAVTATPTEATTKGGEQLPEAGTSYPTVLGIGLGILVIVGAILLAI